MSYNIKHYIEFKGNKADIFAAISTAQGIQNWWTECPTYELKIGGHAHFIFKGNGYHNIMQLTEVDTNNLVEWKVIQGDEQWMDTSIRFELIEKENGTHLRFGHNGWRDQTDFLGHCSFQWGKYLMSLKNLIETGKGNPYADY